MRRFRAKAVVTVTPGWPDKLPAGEMVRVHPSVRTAAELVANGAAPQTAVGGATRAVTSPAKNAA